jgi:hypothetical protein
MIMFQRNIIKFYPQIQVFEFNNYLVGVYFGADNIKDYFPNKKYPPLILASDFNSTKELINYLKNISNDDYLSYFRWRIFDLPLRFQKRENFNLLLKGKNSWICRLCDYYHQNFD